MAQAALDPASDATPGELHLALRLDLHLRQDGPQSGWSAELRAPEAAASLRFAGLPELISFIARLDQTRPGGLR